MMLTADLRLTGHFSIGPSAVADQSNAAINAPNSPPPARNAGRKSEASKESAKRSSHAGRDAQYY